MVCVVALSVSFNHICCLPSRVTLSWGRHDRKWARWHGPGLVHVTYSLENVKKLKVREDGKRSQGEEKEKINAESRERRGRGEDGMGGGKGIGGE